MSKKLSFREKQVQLIKRRERRLTSETPSEYKKNEKEYFGNFGDAKRPGLSAAEAALADKHLPSKKEEHELLDYYTKGYDKTSRSGAFSKAGAGPAIFPNGLKFASKFIDDQGTPGRYKLKQEQRPVPAKQTRPVDTPKAEAVVTHLCVDCLEAVGNVAGQRMSFFIVETCDPGLLVAMTLRPGDLVIMIEHEACWQKAHAEARSKSDIILVRDGDLTSPEDMAIAAKYGFIQRLHSGHEIRSGEWYLALRSERLIKNMYDILVHTPKDSECFRRNRKEAS
jgi:hypothetical protein